MVSVISILFCSLCGATVLAVIVFWLCYLRRKRNYERIKSTKKVAQLVFPPSFNSIHKSLLRNFKLKQHGIAFIECSKTEVEQNKPLVVLCIRSTRVQDTCNGAMEGIQASCKVALVVFHKTVGSTTMEDVQNIGYQHEGVKTTIHVGFDDKRCYFTAKNTNAILSFCI
ncbi:uncharacterized protein LOC128217206 [Mya arenaria]|uniref:uncharacterized protein LOC128217206 n=1 Tax=Mya arenaria TaxID=6604 RepID=UPI0022E40699|nr:uncharacterized protein LOC128217206 [Mya arenaria]